jgi:uncharacterized membrane protein
VSFCGSCGTPVGATGGAPAPSAAPASAGSAMASNVAGLLTYILGVITAIVFLVLEPYNKDKFVRFHAFQSLFFGIAVFVLAIVLSIVSMVLAVIPVVGWIVGLLLWIVFSLGVLVVWIMLMYKAYNNERWMLPVIGKLAEQQAGK